MTRATSGGLQVSYIALQLPPFLVDLFLYQVDVHPITSWVCRCTRCS